MSRYEQLSMFTMNVEQVTATCCMDGCPARASPVEPWMAALIPAGEYVVQDCWASAGSAAYARQTGRHPAWA